MGTVYKKNIARGNLIDATREEVNIEIQSNRKEGYVDALVGFRTKRSTAYFEEGDGITFDARMKDIHKFAAFLEKISKAFAEAAEKLRDEVAEIEAVWEEKRLKEERNG